MWSGFKFVGHWQQPVVIKCNSQILIQIRKLNYKFYLKIVKKYRCLLAFKLLTLGYGYIDIGKKVSHVVISPNCVLLRFILILETSEITITWHFSMCWQKPSFALLLITQWCSFQSFANSWLAFFCLFVFFQRFSLREHRKQHKTHKKKSSVLYIMSFEGEVIVKGNNRADYNLFLAGLCLLISHKVLQLDFYFLLL